MCMHTITCMTTNTSIKPLMQGVAGAAPCDECLDSRKVVIRMESKVKVCKDCKKFGKPCKETGKFVARKLAACEKFEKKN